MLYSFEDFCLDTGRRELRRNGTLISLQPQVFDLLEYLIRNREQVVGKDDLLAAVWNGRIVSEANMSTRINAARSAIGDSGAAQRFIRTVHGKGFRFIGSVREEEETVRKLAAIFAADVAGYSRLMEQDEVGTLRRLTACRAILGERIAASRGRVFGSAGDSVVADFASAVEAVQCAMAAQDALAKAAADLPAGELMRFRIGVHVGDVIVQGENLFGDGVNIAARLEALAEPGGICISGAVRDQIGNKLPLALIDLGEQQVKNITQPLRAWQIGRETGAPAPAAALALPDKPSIAVLPFQNMSGDPEQEYFADGMVEEIITALSRIRWLFVIARNSSFTYKGQAVDVKRVGLELGVRYVVEGSVRKVGYRVRVTVQLIDAQSGAHLWADRFDGSLEDVFELQDKVAIGVAGVIEPALQAAESTRLAYRPTNDLAAFDLYLRALRHFNPYDRNGLVRALDLLERAIERDPDYGPSLALAAHCHQRFEVMRWTDDPEATERTSIALVRRALRSSPDDPDVLALTAFVLGYFGEDIYVSLGLIDRCLALNPSHARGWHWSGLLRVFAGQPEIALEHFENYLRLSPRDRLSTYLNGIGEAYFFSQRFDEAAANLLASLELAPSFPVTYRVLASCHGHRGRLDEAREIVSRLRAITPAVMEPATRYRNPELRELFLSGLRVATGEAG
jgi:adenylate cyclase